MINAYRETKRWFITGSSRGFGRALAQAALEAGDLVAATARRPEQLDELVAEYGDRVRAIRLDVTDAASVEAAIAEPDAEGRALLTRAAERLGLSARAWHRTLRVARTLADLDGSDSVRRLHVAEALSYRRQEPRSMLAA